MSLSLLMNELSKSILDQVVMYMYTCISNLIFGEVCWHKEDGEDLIYFHSQSLIKEYFP